MGSASEPRSGRYLVGRQNQNSRTSTPPPCCRPPPPKPPEPTLQTSSRRPRSRSSPQGQIPLPVNFSSIIHRELNSGSALLAPWEDGMARERSDMRRVKEALRLRVAFGLS